MTVLLCAHDNKETRFTWFNMKTGEQDTGPICTGCATEIWDQINKFPDAVQTFTVWPVGPSP